MATATQAPEPIQRTQWLCIHHLVSSIFSIYVIYLIRRRYGTHVCIRIFNVYGLMLIQAAASGKTYRIGRYTRWKQPHIAHIKNVCMYTRELTHCTVCVNTYICVVRTHIRQFLYLCSLLSPSFSFCVFEPSNIPRYFFITKEQCALVPYTYFFPSVHSISFQFFFAIALTLPFYITPSQNLSVSLLFFCIRLFLPSCSYILCQEKKCLFRF